ncbi:hypothetical protein M408DRAFT_128025 [Serendipita vermifera MAFF 305830]|uniref:Protein-serine/threonine kinase n=1 Tax=Serendipita vermifera MAFF 305830 TaxID=933852 RepID=A0A0C3AX61_SERVB|nr:hypothetical protein M408DRAFT_128025 [Serendipita vermifera MAFF 305830]
MLRCKKPLIYSQRRFLQTRTPPPNSPELVHLLGAFKSLAPRPTPLSTLLSFGAPLTPSSIVLSASYVLEELPRRLVQRVRSMEALPFIVGMNPFISRALNSYRQTFQDLATAPPVVDMNSNIEFTKRLEALVRSHSNDIPVLARGFQECSKYMKPGAMTSFLDGAIRSRIAIRFIAEQHIALTRALKLALDRDSKMDQFLGVVDSECSPAEMVKLCTNFVHELCVGTFGTAPEIVLDGMTDVTFTYVPVHIEYVLTEILKNAFRATVEAHHKRHGSHTTMPLAPVQITISHATLPPTPSDIISNSRIRTPPSYVSIRVRDQGGGVHPKDLPRIFSYAFTTARTAEGEDDGGGGGPYSAQAVGGMAAIADDGDSDGGNLFGEIVGKNLQTGLGTIAGLGYGLPMARLYTGYFGGSLELMSMHGHGTDVFIKFRCLDENTSIEV